MAKGFVQIPRSLLLHPKVLRAPSDYCKVLQVILAKMTFKECTHDDHGVIIHLSPKQIACTVDQLAEWARVKRTTAWRAVKYFSLNRILQQEVKHIKQVITLIYSEACEDENDDSETGSGISLERDWNEIGTQKNNANNAKEENACSAGGKIYDLLDGWKHLVKVSDYVYQCMLCCVDLPVSPAKAVTTLQNIKLSDGTSLTEDDIQQIKNHPEVYLQRIMLACIFVQWKIEKQEEITNLPGLLVWHCKKPDSGPDRFPMPPQKKASEDDDKDDVNEFLAQKYANMN